MEKVRILFLINSLGGGGAEKALVNLINNLDDCKYDITVETMFDDGVNAKLLNNNINYVSKKAPCPKGISSFFKIIPSYFLYKFFINDCSYDILIAYMHGVPVKVICGNKKTKKIAWIHNGNPESSVMFTPWITKNFAFKRYDSCDSIVGVCNSVSDAFKDFTGIRDKVYTAYNTLDTDAISKLALVNPDIIFDTSKINICSTGRLGREKGYSRLLDVCSYLKNDGFDFSLYLIGSGSEENALKNRADELGLNDNVVFLGFQDNPYKYVNKCDIFVCSSFTEGLSTATIEALVLGKAIVSTDVSGAYEILGDNEFGLVVDNSQDGIYKGLKTLMSDEELVKYYQKQAVEHRDVFSIENTVKEVERIIDCTLK